MLGYVRPAFSCSSCDLVAPAFLHLTPSDSSPKCSCCRRFRIWYISPLNDWDGLQLLGVVQSQPLIPTWAWLVNLLLAVWHMFIVDQSFSHSGYPKKPGHVSGSKYETVASSAVFEWLLLTVETASMGTQQKPNRRCWRFPLNDWLISPKHQQKHHSVGDASHYISLYLTIVIVLFFGQLIDPYS